MALCALWHCAHLHIHLSADSAVVLQRLVELIKHLVALSAKLVFLPPATHSSRLPSGAPSYPNPPGLWTTLTLRSCGLAKPSGAPSYPNPPELCTTLTLRSFALPVLYFISRRLVLHVELPTRGSSSAEQLLSHEQRRHQRCGTPNSLDQSIWH